MTECLLDPQLEIDLLYAVNPDLQEKFKIHRVKFALSESQRCDLLKQAEKNFRHYAIIKYQLETGQRVGEIANGIIPNLNLDEAYVTIQSYQKDRHTQHNWKPKTQSGNRIVPLTDGLVSTLKAVVGNRTAGYLFVSNKKSKFYEESLIRIINTYARATPSIGKNIGSHALRGHMRPFYPTKACRLQEFPNTLVTSPSRSQCATCSTSTTLILCRQTA